MKSHFLYKDFKADEQGNIYGVRSTKLKLKIHNSGYYLVTSLNVKGKPTNYYVHRFVWECFNGEIPDKLVINHKDGNKLNNSINNLEAITSSENCKHAISTGLVKIKHGEETSQAILKESEVVNIIKDIQSGLSNSQLVQKYNLDFKHISLIRNKKIWKTTFNKYFPRYIPIKSAEKTVQFSNVGIRFILELAFLTEKTNKEIQNMYNMSDGQLSRIRHYKIWKSYIKKFIEQTSTTIPKGSRTKWFEAVSILIKKDDDMVCSV